jgi:drug/metabolite transporter (DMT)-like permease
MIGILIILASALFLATQNVALKIIVSRHEFLGLFPLGGWVEPTPDHSLLLLQVRMLLTVPLMLLLTPKLHPAAKQELKHLLNQRSLSQDQIHRRYFLRIISANVCVFVALTLVYFAISTLTTGVAVTIFFIHPAITVLYAWWFLGEQARKRQLLLMGMILVGIVLTTPGIDGTLALTDWLPGVLAAIAGAFTYAGYSLLTQTCLQATNIPLRLHPVTFSLVQFIVMLTLASLGLLAIQIQVPQEFWPMILGMSMVSAIAAMTAYILNNIGIQLIGASKTSLISAMTPILTTLLAAFFIQETIALRQFMGICLVTSGIAALSLRFRRS